MMQICRAEDGEVFQTDATLRDIEGRVTLSPSIPHTDTFCRLGGLELFLHQHTGIEEEAVLAYLSDGRRLRNDNLREFAGASDQAIYVFNKFYLDEDLESVLRELHVEAPLQPPVPDDAALANTTGQARASDLYLRAARAHHQANVHLLATISAQRSALRIASNSLDMNVLGLSDVFDGVSANTQRELERQKYLLDSVDSDLQIIARVDIHRQFLSASVQRAMDQGDKGRTLADYVSNDKMRQVAQTCLRSFSELQRKYQEADESMKRLSNGSASVRVSLTSKLPERCEDIVKHSQEAFDEVSKIVSLFNEPGRDSDRLLKSLQWLDTDLRDRVTSLTDLKNALTEQGMRALREISLLNNDLVELPNMLAILQSTLRAKNAFAHIQRLHNMIYAYGATIVEIVRRREFAKFFYQRAQLILEVMAKLSAGERKRRQAYRSEFYGQLPFDLKGMEDAVPSIDFSPSGSSESGPYSLQRSDVDHVMHVLSDLETYVQTVEDSDIALASLREIRANLEKLVQRMDALESGFDRIAERSLLSSSRLALSRRRLSDADFQAYQELAIQLRDAQSAKAEQETAFEAEHTAMRQEISQLKAQVEGSSGDHEMVNKLERELRLVRTQLEGEVRARNIAEERHRDLLANVDRQRQELSQALNDATAQTKHAEILRQDLVQTRAEFEEVKALEARSSAKLSSLLEVQEVTQRNLEAARARGEDLEAQFQAMRHEREDIRRALDEAGKEKDRLLRAQANEHDRQMRDYVAEADGDRAVLEHQFFELRAEMEDTERQLKETTAQLEMREADAQGLREEMDRLRRELREAQTIEGVLREDLKNGRVSAAEFENKLEQSNQLVAQLLDVAIAYRTAHFKALNVATVAVSHPAISRSVAHLGESHVFPTGSRHTPPGPLEEPFPVDPSDPPSALEMLRSFDQDHFLEVIAKTGSTIRKWQKQTKEYRERSKGKISFRNFAKGDLALFLPTRNSVSKPWAAFNVSFPHYFLQATGHLADQLKNREWIVARITSITERVVDQKDPSSNPYGLGDGVKYYMLEVEDWTQPTPTKRRAGSRRVSSEPPIEPLSPPPPLTPPTDNQVEETFPEARGPNSHLFPSRSRSNSTPTAGPSSLSRLLAQAPVSDLVPATAPLETIQHSPVETRTPSPVATPFLPLPSSPPSQPPQGSPLRPGSRASRISTTSRLSAGRIPPFTNGSSGTPTVKSSPTTALTPVAASPPKEMQVTAASTPSPGGSLGEGLMASMLGNNSRRRTASYHVANPVPATRRASNASAGTGIGALASLASWGSSLSRRKRMSIAAPPAAAAATTTAAESTGERGDAPVGTSARELLARLDDAGKQ
ncbi:putative peripheral membrane protein [Vararia minispora EC-137]|uniref:Peripheral membrane protein n=1 Tax=Vararia minispora EC-137 TaxID=1314806 RepID=A0ACB8QMJ0_9AGAM|nr:putative peripheral membrane protein [Vararia minispora EC-137]